MGDKMVFIPLFLSKEKNARINNAKNKGADMYSPRISEELIPELYHIAKAKNIPMTRIVNQFVEQGLDRENKQGNQGESGNEKETDRDV